MVKTIDNKFAVFVIILIVVGLFLHYEMGYNFDLFSVGGRRGHHGHSDHHHRHHRKWHRGWGNWRHWGYHLHPEYDNLHSRLNRANEHHKEHHTSLQPLPEKHPVETF